MAHLKIADFVIVAIQGAKKKTFSQFVYKITELNDDEIYGDWYKQNPEHLDIFKETNEKETLFDLEHIIMKLPEPCESRGRYIFEGNILLKNNVKFV